MFGRIDIKNGADKCYAPFHRALMDSQNKTT
jgi:hypothetical protein